MARPRQVSDDEILAEVRRGVLEQGPSVSLDLIAHRLNVTAPALFKRFGSRNALLLAALKPDDAAALMALLKRGPDEGRPFEPQLLEIMEAHAAFLETTVPCMSALRESGLPKEEMRELFKESPFPSLVKRF